MGVALVPQDHSERGSVAVWKWALCGTHLCQPFAYLPNPSPGERWVKPQGHTDAESEFHTGSAWVFNT